MEPRPSGSVIRFDEQCVAARRLTSVRDRRDWSMKRTRVDYAAGFNVLLGDERSQAASMVISAGDKEGGADNLHKGADQWLYVESGKGEAIVNGHKYPLEAG